MNPSKWAVVALTLVLPHPPAAHGSERSVTVEEATRLFLQGSPRARLAEMQAREAGADLRIGSSVPNPSVAYLVEEAAGTRDEFVTFQQELPVTGRRGFLRRRAEAAATSVELEGHRELQRAAWEMKSAFYEVLYWQEAAERLLGSDGELERIVEVLRLREREGEGSGYDVLRAEQERDRVRLELRRAEGALATARARFGSFFEEGMEMESASLVGDFSVGALPRSTGEAVSTALAARADLRALQGATRREELELRAARRERWPEPVLSLGWKRVESDQSSDTGFAASLTVPLPLFSRGTHAAARARAASGKLEARRSILEREIRREVSAAMARAKATVESARALEEGSERRAGELWRIAGLAYDEGEMGILELMDAHRTMMTIKLQVLEARHDAKRESLALRRAMGREVGP